MSEKPKAKIYQFPNKTKANADKTSSPLDELKALFATPSAPETPKPKVRKPKGTQPQGTVSIQGDGNQVAGGHIINHYGTVDLPAPVVVVQTGVGVISAAQKRQLLDLRDQVVEASAVRKEPKTHASVMSGLKRYMKVNKYDEILDAHFSKALNWLRRQRGTMMSMKSAPKKIPNWRNDRIAAIHARCKEKDLIAWRFNYMEQKFKAKSMKELSDQDLDALYRAVMSKK